MKYVPSTSSIAHTMRTKLVMFAEVVTK